MLRLNKKAISWAFYDCANSAFVLTVVAGFFGPFYHDYWSGGSEQAFFWQGVTVSFASLIVAVIAPILGALADQAHLKKRFLFVFMLLGAVSTAGFFLVGRGNWQLASIVYILGFIGFASANIFYDSLLLHVSDENNRHFVSGFGFALGYGGSVILFIANIILVNNPSLIGIEDKAFAVKISFLSVSAWWILFSLPLLIGVKEMRGVPRVGIRVAIRKGLVELSKLFKEIVGQPHVIWFLIAYWLYIDGVNTLITMATGFGSSLGFSLQDLMVTLIIVQIVGVPASLLFGWLGQHFGAKKLILTGIIIYLGVTIFAARLSLEPVQVFGLAVSEIHVLGFLVGSVQGGVQSLSRSFFANIIPPDRAAAYFGFYNMVGKFAALLGPVLMGTVARLSGEPRLGALAVAILFLLGGACLLKVSSQNRAIANDS
jgi:UMF1 family MFS transporter